MNTEHLKRSLQTLHNNLEATGEVDAELRQLLQTLDDDIQALLKKAGPAPSDADDLAERAQELSAKFAAQHPRIEPALRELGTMLANMGI